MSKIEEKLALHLRAEKIKFEREYRFHDKRKWRYDFYLPDYNLLIECQGGIWGNGKHSRGRGYMNDCDKMNEAVKMGYRVMWFTGEHVDKGSAIDLIKEIVSYE